MPLTPVQLKSIDLLLNGDPLIEPVISVNSLINALVSARTDIESLARIHEDIPDTESSIILDKARTRLKLISIDIQNLIS